MHQTRVEVTEEGTWGSMQHALGAVLDIIEAHRLTDIRRVEIDTREDEAVSSETETAIPPWRITVVAHAETS